MKPFNLKEAKAGKPVVTRDGREVKQLTIFDSTDNYCIAGVLDENIKLWNIDGTWSSISGESENDLFMKAETKTLWFNLYKDTIGYFASSIYEDERGAKRNSTVSAVSNYISTHTITIEV